MIHETKTPKGIELRCDVCGAYLLTQSWTGRHSEGQQAFEDIHRNCPFSKITCGDVGNYVVAECGTAKLIMAAYGAQFIITVANTANNAEDANLALVNSHAYFHLDPFSMQPALDSYRQGIPPFTPEDFGMLGPHKITFYPDDTGGSYEVQLAMYRARITIFSFQKPEYQGLLLPLAYSVVPYDTEDNSVEFVFNLSATVNAVVFR
ncbi:MAG TPA: hypothetical protein PKM59_16370 [Thermodesulfobacteriota bacterium]|nr:hypothetical protein [Thermodesulfobacteriota bacterium]HOX87888.1 hypothetical protein [bacterium]